jgi:hypothetical protein
LADEQNRRPDQPEDNPQSPPSLGVNRNADEADARREREKQHERADKRRQIWMVVFTGVIALATLVYTGVSARQLITMNNQLTEAKAEASSNSDAIKAQLRKLNASVYDQGRLAIAGAKAAMAAKSAAETAATALVNGQAEFSGQMAINGAQLRAMKKGVNEENRFAAASEKSSSISARTLADHEAEQRANVALFGSVSYASGQGNVAVQAINIGQTSARQVRVAFSFRGYSPAATQAEVIRRQGDLFSMLLRQVAFNAPQHASPESVAYLAPARDVTLNGVIPNMPEATWEMLRHGRGGWVLVARVTYDDIYGGSHWTNLCTYEVGGDTAQNCPSHNDQGDYTKPHLHNARPLGTTLR